MSKKPPMSDSLERAELERHRSEEAPLSQRELNALFGIDSSEFPEDAANGLSREVIGSIVALFLDDTPRRMASAHAAIQAGNMRSAGLAFHSIKGGAGYLGAKRVQALCLKLEKLSKADALDEVVDGIPELEQALDELSEELRAYYGLPAKKG